MKAGDQRCDLETGKDKGETRTGSDSSYQKYQLQNLQHPSEKDSRRTQIYHALKQGRLIRELCIVKQK